MSEITVTFACGHRAAVSSNADGAVCAVCGERRVQRVSAPPPRILSVNCRVTGPTVVTHA